MLKLLSLFLLMMISTSMVYGKDFVDEVEKDYSLRSIGTLRVTNAKGDISIQGWSMDKVRIKLKKRVTADTPAQAEKLFDAVHYRYTSTDGNIEISSQYGNSLSIADRLKEKDHPSVRMDFIIYAPSSMKLSIWSVDGKVNLKNWNATVDVRASGGGVRLEGIKSDSTSVFCKTCSVQLKNIKSSVRCMGGTGNLELIGVLGKDIYVQTTSGQLKLWRIRGDQLYISESGSIDGQILSGKVTFQAHEASVGFKDVSGFLSGSAKSGDITASFRDWEFQDKSLIESTTGKIQLTLPRRFSGDIDVWSLRGKVVFDFPFEKTQSTAVYGPEQENHLTGKVSEGGELLKVFSDGGDISILRGQI